MLRALQLAKLGGTDTYPNPLVGAVVIYKDKIIGEGWHQKYGEPHAEVNAINNVQNKELLSESSIYVTLEPCSHHGKTPPCSDLIIKNNLKRVIIGCIDTFSEVSGRGVEKLRNAGINVEVGIHEQKARELNKRFFTFHEKKRPYITLKWAQSSDGFIDIKRNSNERTVNWITQKETKIFVHRLRSNEHAILVGWKTIANDNPELTVRMVEGKSPIRLVLDPNCKSPGNSRIFQDDIPTWLICKKNNYQFSAPNTLIIEIDEFSLPNVLKELHDRNILSVFIEGGGFTINQFIQEELWDEAYKIEGITSFQDGEPAPVITSNLEDTQFHLGKDRITFYKNK